MATSTVKTCLRCILIVAVSLSIAKTASAAEPNWSVCSDYFIGRCQNGVASDDATFSDLRPTGVSVRGLFIFFVRGLESNEPDGLGEFVFQERVGDYHHLSEEISGQVGFLKRMGDYDWRDPSLTMVNELSLLSNGASRFYNSAGSVDACLTETFSYKSLTLHGPEPWEIFGRNDTSVCVQLEDTNSLIPGIVRDIRTLGLDHELRNVCRVARGTCSKAPGEIIKISNNERSGVIRR